MKRLVFVLLLIVACVAGLGFYLGWFRIESGSTSDTGQIKLTVDKDKIHQDEKKAEAKVEKLEHKVTDK
jgi:hypothetical protein